MRYVLTPGGMKRLRERLDRTRAEYQAVCDDNPAALESGDSSGWHDNFAFEDNQRRMQMLAGRIRTLERMVERAEVTPGVTGTPERVVVGTTIRWRFEEEAEERCVWLAGFDDGEPKQGRISYNSPLGRALLGASVGELREVKLAGRERHIEVLALGPTPAEERRA